MTAAQLDQIPSDLLFDRGTRGLREYLDARGWRMTLLELMEERTRRKNTYYPRNDR